MREFIETVSYLSSHARGYVDEIAAESTVRFSGSFEVVADLSTVFLLVSSRLCRCTFCAVHDSDPELEGQVLGHCPDYHPVRYLRTECARSQILVRGEAGVVGDLCSPCNIKVFAVLELVLGLLVRDLASVWTSKQRVAYPTQVHPGPTEHARQTNASYLSQDQLSVYLYNQAPQAESARSMIKSGIVRPAVVVQTRA